MPQRSVRLIPPVPVTEYPLQPHVGTAIQSSCSREFTSLAACPELMSERFRVPAVYLT